MASKVDLPKGGPDSPTGLVLKVVIMRGRNLAAKDRSGTSDPYLVLTCGDSRIQTHTVPKTLNPDWNTIEEIPITSYQNLLLDVVCWDKDRFGKDYMGEFDLALEEIFANQRSAQEPKWYPLRSKRPGKKTGYVSGELQLQFTLVDTSNKNATPRQIIDKLGNLARSAPGSGLDSSRNITPSRTPVLAPTIIPRSVPASSSRGGTSDDEEDELELDADESDIGGDPEDKRKRRLRIKGLRKRKQNPYAFTNGDSDVMGIIFLEICRITDLPPESNLTRTSFDMDPFVVASLGKKTYRTKRIRHNLNPVYNEKMIFQIQPHEKAYSFAFTVIDHDKYSGNDFVASCTLPIQEIIEKATKADLETGLYELREPSALKQRSSSKSRLKRLGLSRTSSTSSLSKIIRPGLSKNASSASSVTPSVAGDAAASRGNGNGNGNGNGSGSGSGSGTASATLLAPPADGLSTPTNELADPMQDADDLDPDFIDLEIPLVLKNLEKWEAKHNPVIYLRAKYMAYPALRQQFWRALLRQYDTDRSGHISRVEMTTMLDSIGSTLRETTIDGFFQRFPHGEEEEWELTMDEAVICLEEQLEAKSKPKSVGDKLKRMVPDMKSLNLLGRSGDPGSASASGTSTPQISIEVSEPTLNAPSSDFRTAGDESDSPDRDDFNDEEHVVEIRECPICHQPRLNKRSDTDIITHIATCASQDWRQVNNVLVSGFVTASQAQRKWYSKVITKISYGGYKLGANSANILVQDRLTGQINEEKMSVYVRLGIRMLYKGLKSREMENKRIRKMLKNLSIKQGKKFDDPASREEIEKFIAFHRLNMSEVLLPLNEFNNFNEFFYRALKPGARPCSAPDNSKIIVSPADCRSVVFNEMSQATSVWVKGREFNMKRLLGDAYPEDVSRFDGGSLGIFRLAPQDYHRFHMPVDGIMGEPRTIEGEYYTVNPMAIRSALDVYGENVRVLVPIDSEQHGRVMVICVGAMMVGSTVITATAGQQVKRADELGYFKFGGSTILLLFEPGKMLYDDDLVDNSSGALETLVRVGMSVGHSPDEPQWAPDMRKDEQEITDAEKKEAKRRIQGSAALEDSPEGSGEDEPRHSRKPSAAPTVNTLAASAM
ncbi:unnamed protein product [Clonostachys solani]|uniref:Phosphatidylserine decarboxylase proenzyme 2 n=1 Tax=Clonostachys solani TaxID=160281 RepID=A0A9P0ESC4_9HYPO|nr:unnamed protein product [Clonostachys solani]